MATSILKPPPGFELDEEFPSPPDGYELDSDSVSFTPPEMFQPPPMELLSESARNIPDMQATTRGGPQLRETGPGAMADIARQFAQEPNPSWDTALRPILPSDLEPEQSLVGISPEEVPSGEAMTKATGIPEALTIPAAAGTRSVSGVGQFMTSPTGIAQTITAMIPGVGLLQRAQWLYDMTKGTGEAAGNLSANIEKALASPDKITSEEWQEIADDSANAALMLFGAGKLASHEVAKATGIRAPLGRIIESDKKRLSKDLAQELAKSELTPAASNGMALVESAAVPAPPEGYFLDQPGKVEPAVAEVAKAPDTITTLAAKKPGEVTVEEMSKLSDSEASALFDAQRKAGNANQNDGVRAGLKLTAENIPQLEKLRNEAMDKFQEHFKAGDNASYQGAMGKVTWLNGAIEGAKKSGPNYAEVLSQEGRTIGESIGAKFDGEAMGMWNFTTFDKAGNPSTSFVVKAGSTPETVTAKYNLIRDNFEGSESQPRPPQPSSNANAQPKAEPSKAAGDQLTPVSGEQTPAAKPVEAEFAKAEKTPDPFERARTGDEKAFDDLDNQFRETYPDPAELESRPSRDQVHTPQAFASKFNAAFASRDFDTILDTIKATSDVSIWKPFLQDLFKRQAKDPIAAEKAEWMRHVFNGTRPASAIPRPPPKASAPPRPAPPVTPTPRAKPGAAPPPKPPPTPPSPPPVRIPVDPIAGGGGKSPYRIIEDFSASIGKAIRVLRMKKNGLGVYRPGSTLTAERFAGDLDTAAHELAGHWSDDKHGIGKPWVAAKTRSPYDSELAKFWIHGSVTPRSTLRYRRAEGIAEFIRAYVVNPKQAKLDAPNFAAYFEKTLPTEALKAINDFGTDVRRWAGEDPLVRAGLNIRMTPPTVAERLWKGLHGRGFGFEINPIDRLRLWFDDPYHYAVKAFHQISDLRGGKLKPEQNFELLSRLLATHDSRMGDQFASGLVKLRTGQKAGPKGELEVERIIDPVTNEPMSMKWLLGAFDRTSKDKFNQDMRDASAYMVAERTIEKGAQLGKDRVSGIGAGIISDKQAAQELLRRVAADPVRETRLKEAARRYRLWADQNLNMLVDAGRMSKESARKIREDNQQYVDMHRLSEEFESGFRSQRGGGIGTTRDVIKRFKGSTLELDNVYSNLLEQTDSIQREAHRNVVMRSFVDGLTQVRELHGPNLKDFDQFGRKVTSADRNTIKVFKDGKPENWQFDPEIYDSLKGLGDLGSHAFIDLLALPSRLTRYMITHGPQFIIRNPIRDAFERSVTSRSGSKPWDVLKGYSQAELSRYEVFGGGQFGNYIVDRHVWNRELKKTMRELTKDKTNIFLSPLKLKNAWEGLAEKSEKLGRVAEFRRAFDRGRKELGYDDYNAALYAAGEARGLLDFAKAGEVMKSINKLVPFSNARIRGLARSAFGFKENPGKFAMRWGMFVLVPTIANMLWNRQDKDTWEEYQQLPAYQKDFFWNFKVGPYWLRIPKPHELGVMAGGVERAVHRLLGDERALEGWMRSSTSAALPVSTPVEGTGPLKTMLELEFNRDTFRNRDIIPAWERDLKLDLRKGTQYASGAGKGIASALNVTGLTIDPRQVDYVLGSYGGLGQIATSTTGRNRGLQDAAIKATGLATDPAGTAARDVQWVIDWAKKNGKMNDSRIERLQDLRKRVFEEKDANQRAVKSADLRKYAAGLREGLDK